MLNRGKHKDYYGNNVNRIIGDVNIANSYNKKLVGKHFDVVFNDIAYSAKSVRNIINNISFDRYIQLSSVYVYENLHLNLEEIEFKPSKKTIFVKDGLTYREGKQESESVLTLEFEKTNYCIVRIPYVLPTERLDFYTEKVRKSEAIPEQNLDDLLCFTTCCDLGNFLVWIANQDYKGIINFSSEGTISVRDICNMAKDIFKKEVMVSSDPQNLPFIDYNYSLNLDKVKELGYNLEDVRDSVFKNIKR